MLRGTAVRDRTVLLFCCSLSEHKKCIPALISVLISSPKLHQMKINKRLVTEGAAKNEVLDDNIMIMSMIKEYNVMPFLLSKPKISERDAHPASRPAL